ASRCQRERGGGGSHLRVRAPVGQGSHRADHLEDEGVRQAEEVALRRVRRRQLHELLLLLLIPPHQIFPRAWAIFFWAPKRLRAAPMFRILRPRAVGAATSATACGLWGGTKSLFVGSWGRDRAVFRRYRRAEE